MPQFSPTAQEWLNNNTSNPSASHSASPKVIGGYSPAAQQWLTTNTSPQQKVSTKPVVQPQQPQAPQKSFLQNYWDTFTSFLDKIPELPTLHAGLISPVPDKNTMPQAKQVSPVDKALEFAGNMAGGYLNSPAEAGKAVNSLSQNYEQKTSTPQQVAADVASIAMLPLLFLGGEEAAGAKGFIEQTAKSTLKDATVQVGKQIGKGAIIGGGFGLLGGVQSGKYITNLKDYVNNIISNTITGAEIGVGAEAGVHGVGLATKNIVVPLAKGVPSMLGAIFIKDAMKEPKIVNMQLDPKVAQNLVLSNEELSKSPAGKAIVKESLTAQDTNSHVAIMPTEDGKYTLPTGDKVNITTQPIYDPKSNNNPVPKTAVQQSEGHVMLPLDHLVSVKNEPRKSIDNAKMYMDKSINGEISARKPIDVIPLKDGKYLISDGNATFHAAKEAGYTHIPAQVEDTTKLKGATITDEQIKQAAEEHFQADAKSKEYGKMFSEIATKYGLEKAGKAGKANVKSIVNILEKKYIRKSEVNDILRDTILIKHPEDVGKIVEELKARGFSGDQFNSERRVNGLKNRYLDNTPGYKDANFHFVSSDGQRAELQMMQRNMYQTKKIIGHAIYDLVDKAGKTKDITFKEQQALDVLRKTADDQYKKAYFLDNPESAASRGDLATVNNEGISAAGTLLSSEDIKSLNEHLYTLRQAESASLRSESEKVVGKLEDVISKPSIAENVGKVNEENTRTNNENLPNKKVLTGNEVRAIRDVMEAKLSQIRDTASTPDAFSKGVDKLVADVKERAQGDKPVLSALRTELNKEMYGMVGDNGGYKKNYAMLQEIRNADPEMGAIIDNLDNHIREIDEILLKTPDRTAAPPAFAKERLQKAGIQTGEPTNQLPVGTGKLKTSKVYEHTAERLLALDPERFKDFKDGQPYYNVAKAKEQVEMAANFIEKDPQKAFRVAMGYENPPAGLLPNDVSVALSDRALAEKNDKLVARVETSMSLHSTREGQDIAALRGRGNENSPHAFIQQVMSQRLNKLGKSSLTDAIDMTKRMVGKTGKQVSSVKERAVARIDMAAERLSKQLKRQQAKIQSAQSLLDQLTCK